MKIENKILNEEDCFLNTETVQVFDCNDTTEISENTIFSSEKNIKADIDLSENYKKDLISLSKKFFVSYKKFDKIFKKFYQSNEELLINKNLCFIYLNAFLISYFKIPFDKIYKNLNNKNYSKKVIKKAIEKIEPFLKDENKEENKDEEKVVNLYSMKL